MGVIQTINPATETTCGTYNIMSQDEVANIIEKMHRVQQSWSNCDIDLRMQCLDRAGDLLLKNKVNYATLITNEMGKPMTQAIGEIEKCARLCKYYAKESKRFLQPEMIQTEYYKSYRSFQPLGIIFAIMPWNFPFWQVMRFAAPNLMLGNAGLLKHAPNSTGTAIAIEKLFVEAGFPEGLFRSLVIDVDLAPFVIHHPHIQGVTLTGSNIAGQSVAKEAGMALKKVVLELGGSDPYVILEDADLDRAAEQCVLSRLGNAGQVCIAAKRLIVVNAVKEAFEAKVAEKVKQYEMGDPLDASTLLGPMARADLRTKLDDQIKRAIKKGARCVLGGVLPKGTGYYYPATLLLDVTVDSPAFREEMFGPVVCITGAKDETEALRLANQSEFGLAAAVFTSNIAKGEAIARDALIAGTCAVNVYVSSDPRLPFGGIKQSGYGRELAIEGMREFANIKTVIVQ